MNQKASWVQNTVALVVCSIFAAPLLWMVLSSFKAADELTANPYSLLPKQWTWENYPQALAALPYLRYLSNSLLQCLGSVVVGSDQLKQRFVRHEHVLQLFDGLDYTCFSSRS